MTYQEQRTLIIAACEKAGACEREFRRLKRTRSERTFFAVLRNNAGGAAHYLPAYLPDGTYGQEGYLLFGVVGGQLHGKYKEWHPSGNLWMQAHCVQGQRHGEYKWWDDNGTLREHVHYQHGRLHGEYKRWYEDGNLHKHCHYQHDQLHGECKRWHPDGTLWEHSHYQQGELNGECKWWDWDGTLWIHCRYQQGVKIKDYFA